MTGPTKNTAILKQEMLVNKLRDVLGRMEIATMLSSDAMVWTDHRGRIQWCNNAFEDLVSFSRYELLGQMLVELLPLWQDGRQLPPNEHPAGLAAEQMNHRVGNYAFFNKEIGQTFDLEIAQAPTNAADEQTSIVLVIRKLQEPLLTLPADKIDEAVSAKMQALIDENRELLNQLQQARDQLASSSTNGRSEEVEVAAGYRTKNAFLANMTHELRTPLSAIMGFADLLRRELLAHGHTDWARDVAQIRQASDRLFFMITQLLDLAAIEEHQYDLKPTRFEVARLIAEVETVGQGYMAEQNNRLTVVVRDGVTTIFNDEGKLRKVLLHLLSNAAKFTVQGEVELTVSPAEEDEGKIAFIVRDNGIGLLPNQIARLFQPFTQGDESMTRRYEGGGVGLYLAKQFCEMMGGTIGVESEPGEGAAFTILIPTEWQPAS